MSACASVLLVLMTLTPAQLASLRAHRDAEHKKADLLARDGRYAEAVKVLEALGADLHTKLKDVPAKDQERAYLATSGAVVKNALEELAPMKEWAAKSGTDAQLAVKLLLAVLHPKRIAFDGYRATVRDAQVQKLLASLRKLDPQAAKLLGPRKVKVIVTAPALEEASRAYFAAELVSTLQALGIHAAVGVGTEPLEVELALKGPVSAHLIGDDVDECALIAVAKWPAASLSRLDLTSHGFGDEETPGDCFKDRVRDCVALAAEQIIRTALRMPLAGNLNKAEGPNGVFE